MSETIEKIYCCDHGNNDSALAAAILANGNRRDDWGPMAAAMYNNNQNEWMNNPFAYMMFAAIFGDGFGNNRRNNGADIQGAEIQARLNSIQSQLNDNQNADCIKAAIQGNAFAISQLSQTLNIDFNTLQKCCCDVQAAIQQVAGQVGFSAERVINAAERGDQAILSKLCECCCSTQRQIADFRADIQLQNCKDTAELRNGQRDLGVALAKGFSDIGFQAQQDKCDIIRANQDNTQRIIDTLNQHWTSEQQLQIQDLKNRLSQKEQNETFAQMIRNSCRCNNNCNNGCNCNNDCSSF